MNKRLSSIAIIEKIRHFAKQRSYPLTTSWCQCTTPENAGDYYTKWLLDQLGFNPILDPKDPYIYVSGSILGTKLRSTPGIIWGLGMGNDEDSLQSRNLVAAVRGKLSVGKIAYNVPTGDPGCLASLIVESGWRPHDKPVIGIIPRYIDEAAMAENMPCNDAIQFKLISMRTNDLAALFNEISECDFIASSSLHGIIFAHAFLKPAIHIELNELESKDNFKFRDYYSNFATLDYTKCHRKLFSAEDLGALEWGRFLMNASYYKPDEQEVANMQYNLLKEFPICENDEHSKHEPQSKSYNGEPAIISLTSWTKRIRGVGLTIFSILTQCPGYHITLTLSKEEFPNGMNDLPTDIQLLCKSKKIEILWTPGNRKSLKKVLYTIEHYPFVPVISADDDLIYTCNYANELYSLWKENPSKICTINAEEPLHTNGTATLYYPGCFGKTPITEMEDNRHLDVYMNADDGYYELLRARYNIKVAYLRPHKIWEDRNGACPLHDIYGKPGYLDMLRKIQSEDLGRPIGL